MFRGRGVLGFLVSWFLGFRVSWCLGFKDSKNPFMCLKDIWSILPHSHFMFLIDIDRASKIFKIILDGSVEIFGPCLFENCQNMDFRNCWIYKITLFKNGPGIFLDFFRYPGVSKDK